MNLSHRVRWIGRADVPGWWCRSCGEFAGSVRAMQTHADLHEPRRLDTRYLMETK